MGFPGDTSGKEATCQCRRHKRRRFDLWEDPLEEGMATHSIFLVWRIPMDRGPRRASPWGRRVGHNWSDLAGMQTADGDTKYTSDLNLSRDIRKNTCRSKGLPGTTIVCPLRFLCQWRDFRLWVPKGREGQWKGFYMFNYKTNQNLLNV